MSIAVRSFAVGWLLACASASHERFPAMETSPVLAPRFYHAAPARPLGRRQAQCNPGNHPCNEIGDVGSTACCPDDSYCIVNPTTTTLAACCPIGSTCGSRCNEREYQCAVTATSTVDGSVTTSVAPACCPRACTSTSQFGCPSSLGGGCCSYGSVCGTNVCLSTLTASSSTSALVSQVPAGCTTSQITCAASLGGGCCAVTQSCTMINGAAHCADILVTPTASGVSRVEEAQGLSAGAKAGIGVGVVVGAGLIIGAITWLCVRKRRASRSAAASSSERPRPSGVIGTVLGTGRDVTDDTSEMVSHGVPPPGVTQEYFGPDPAIGPFSDFQNPSGGTTPGVDRGGVPLAPHGPGDIAVPVEIDSRAPQPGAARESASYAPSRTSIPAPAPVPATETTEGRFELYGSEMLSPTTDMPSPITPIVPSPLDETPQSALSEEPKKTYGS